MDFIHIADLHASKNRLEPCLQVLNKLFSYISSKEEKPALFIAGDFWDSVMQNTEASGFTRIFSAMKKIIDITRVVFISGTPNHEPEGSLKIFEELGADVFYNPEIKDYGDFEIVAIPEPRRSNFQCSTIEEQSRQINASLDSFLESIPPKTKPRIVIYHGEVSGSVYQNGSNASSPIALSKERLQKADADYYALGHIHLPQELWKNCWYVGSCFPKDAGEHHKAGFHCVHIGPHATYFKRLSFGFAENVTEHVMYQNIDDIKAKKFKGKNLTLKVAIDKLLKKSFNKIELEEEIKEATGAESVRILFEYLEENNIRSNQLVTEKSLVEKFKIYCDINEIKYTDNTLLKLQEIQDNLIEESFVPCDTFELEYVSVRGAIGIRDGMGLDEFNLDFTKYDNGVLAIIGKNGGGKCITGNSIILSDRGFETIGSYDNGKRGFRKLRKKLISDKYNSDTTSHFYSEEVSKTIKIKNNLGMTLEGTEEHPVLCCLPGFQIEFKKLKDIKEGDYVVVPRGMNSFNKNSYCFDFSIKKTSNNMKLGRVPKTSNGNLAAFLGYYIANGSCYNYSINFSTSYEKIATSYSQYVMKSFGVKTCKIINKERSASNYTFTSKEIYEFLKYVFGGSLETARYKTVPDCILQGTREEQRLFLRTLFDCDSSMSEYTFEYCTASEQISNSVQNMLLNFGIVSSHLTKTAKGYDWTYHRICIKSKDLYILFDTILYDSEKYKKPQKKAINTNKDIIPYLNTLLADILDSSKSGTVTLNGKIATNVFVGFHKNHAITYELLNKIIETSAKTTFQEFKDIRNILEFIYDKNFFYSKVVKKEILNEPKTVYDFTIPKSHQFYSNGYISHNTTLLENCHPFPRMLTRSGALKEHFCLAKSHRILVYKTSAGKRIRIKMLINGVSNAENTRYFVETKEPDSDIWVAYKGVDGTLPSYKDWVNNTFGTYKMFLRTSFYANKYIKELPDLSIATKTEKMALFTTLAGIEYFTTVAETAKERAKAADEELKDLKKDVTNYDEIRERLRKAEDTIKENTQNIENEKSILDNDEKTLAEYQKKQEEFLRAVGSAGIIRKTLSEKKSDLVDVSKKIDNLRMDIESAEADLMRKDFFQQQLDWWETSIKQEDEFKAERERQNTALTALATEKTELQLKEMQIKDKLSAIKEDIIRKEGELKLLKKNVHTINDVCPVCGEKLSEHKKEQLLKDNAETKKQIEKLQKDIEDLNTSKVPFEQDYEKTRYAIEQNTKDSITASGAIQEINVSLTQINSYRTEVDIEKAKYVIEQLQPEADRMSAALQEEIDRKKVIEEAIADLQKQEDSIPDDYSLKIQKIQDGILDSRDKITTWTSEINIANQVIEELTEKSKIIVDITSKAKEIEERLKDYTLIQKAFSYTGIQSLELDSAAPEISAIANDILAKSYGDRFTITFETQRDAKDGRKIDDFIIMVFDQKTGRRKELDMLSTGESIWIKQALYFAFSVIRSSRSGFCFKTRFIDESDGALDSEARPRYLKMLESAHESCGATLTVMVTHSQEIKDIVSQKLTLLD